MLKKIVAGIVGASFAAASMFTGTAAFAVDRFAGQVDGDFGGTYVHGVEYDSMGVDNDASEWTTSIQDGDITYVAGFDDGSGSIVVEKFNLGVKDTSFGGDGKAEFGLSSDASIESVDAIQFASNGDLIIFGSFYDDCVSYANCDVTGIYATRITNSGIMSTAGFGNETGDDIETGDLPFAAYFPTQGMDLNNNWIDSYIAEVTSFDLGGGLKFAIAGTSEGDGDSAWVLFINENGSIDTSYGNSVDAGFTYLDSDYNTDFSGQNCYSYSFSDGIVFDSNWDELYWLVECDEASAIQALDPAAGGSPDSWWANSENDEDGFLWIGNESEYGFGAWGQEIEIDSNDNLIIGGGTWAYNPNLASNEWSPWVARLDTSGTYYVDNDGWAEAANQFVYDYTMGNGYWNMYDMDLGSDDSIYFTGIFNADRDEDIWAIRFGGDLQPDYSWNDDTRSGNTVYGGCGDERVTTAEIVDGSLHLFGEGQSPVSAPGNPYTGNYDAISTRIGLGNFTQTRSVVAAPEWTDSEWNDTFIPGEVYTDGVSASGTGVSYYLAGELPDGVSLNPSTGAITGTTDVNDGDSHGFAVCAANTAGHVWTQWEYIAPPQPYAPVIDGSVSLDDEAPYLGESLEWTVSVDAVPTAWCFVNDGELPPGLSLNEDTCVVTGTPLIKGDYWFEIGAENSEGSDYQEFDGSVGGVIDTSISASLTAELGDLVDGSDVDLLGYGLEANSEWYAELHSDPIRFDDGIVNEFGWFSLTSTLPNDIEPGEHTITVYGTDVDGNPTSAVVYITVKADGTLGYISTVQSESASLASTGVDTNVVNSGLLAGLVLLTAGIAVAVRRRRA